MDDDDNEVTTDEKGIFEIKVPYNTELGVAAAGYKTRYVKAAPGLTEIELTSSDVINDVNVLFRVKAQKDLIGGVNAVDMKELIKRITPPTAWIIWMPWFRVLMETACGEWEATLH
ncbi:hypothetical protein LWM68_11985 [Niabella sp. W65]|nr:hypothetical protein [Niabella sp. W65]MCH7363400.1 hypothetical protein [Niabella sp. W65]ULT39325.1 hypothetical protein KRR40_30765 [Niabella sp. I65]